ncbi:MAG: nucleotidyltransferase domain-containing protein [Armatimonadota bacterium]
MKPTKEQLDELVRRIVEAVHPMRIILFGSAARGEMRRDSDIDVMVVVPEGTNPHQIMETLYPRMVGLGIGVDLLVSTPDLLEKHKASIGMVYRDVWRDGVELYAA